MATMKAARVHEWGGSENVFVDDVPIPEPKSGEVVIRVHASSINPADWKVQLGYMKDWFSLPLTLGWDAAGEIAAIGEGVTDFKVGDAVYAKPTLGGFAQYAAVPAANVALRSQKLSAAEAATFPTAALTAYQAIFDKADLQAGQKILIHGAAGGCGHFAVQLARWKGAHVIGTGSAENEAFVRGLGAEDYIDYKTTRFEDVVHDADVVFDTVGGETFTRSFAAAKQGGIVVTIAARPEQPEINGVRGAGMSSTGTTPQLTEMTRLIDEGHIKPTISATYPLDQVRAALDQNHAGHTRGKIVLEIP